MNPVKALGLVATLVCVGMTSAVASTAARDLGVPFNGTPGPLDAITDVPGVEVGQVTLISGGMDAGPAVRSGVTVVLPRGREFAGAVNGGFFNLNGNGELTGQSYLQDFGVIHGPIGISSTNAVGQVYAGIQQWTSQHFGSAIWPVVAETSDGYLNDIEGFHVKPETAMQAIDDARGGVVAEGGVGGGTGMVCFGFKGGIGTASRVVSVRGNTYTVGVLAQCNTGKRDVLRIGGAPVGRELAQRWLACFVPGSAAGEHQPPCQANGLGGRAARDQGSIIIVVGTDAPLQPLQLNRVAKRAALGLARLGAYSGNSSGDLMLAFSTTPGANDTEHAAAPSAEQIPNDAIDDLFEATVDATEEAITNALVAATTMTGVNGYRAYGLPHAELRAILKKYNRVADSAHGRRPVP